MQTNPVSADLIFKRPPNCCRKITSSATIKGGRIWQIGYCLKCQGEPHLRVALNCRAFEEPVQAFDLQLNLR